MSNHPFKSKEFKVLEDLWYAKLKSDGFEDIEYRSGHVKWDASAKFSEAGAEAMAPYYKSKEEYYRLAGHFLHDHVFEDKLDKDIWTMHAEGMSLREISKALKDRGIQKATTQVKLTVHRLRKIMKGSKSE